MHYGKIILITREKSAIVKGLQNRGIFVCELFKLHSMVLPDYVYLYPYCIDLLKVLLALLVSLNLSELKDVLDVCMLFGLG